MALLTPFWDHGLMLISDILRTKGADVTTVPPSTSLLEVIHVLTTRRIGAVVVSPDGGEVVGILSERDVVAALATHDLRGTTAEDIMSTEVITAVPDEDLETLAATMTDRRVRHLPVVVDGRLAGIVSIGDVVKARLTELQDERDHLVGYLHS